MSARHSRKYTSPERPRPQPLLYQPDSTHRCPHNQPNPWKRYPIPRQRVQVLRRIICSKHQQQNLQSRRNSRKRPEYLLNPPARCTPPRTTSKLSITRSTSALFPCTSRSPPILDKLPRLRRFSCSFPVTVTEPPTSFISGIEMPTRSVDSIIRSSLMRSSPSRARVPDAEGAIVTLPLMLLHLSNAESADACEDIVIEAPENVVVSWVIEGEERVRRLYRIGLRRARGP
ncbi:uncharacterized protein BDW70DRAFT_134437 [Aspergillus foveolatus]|uniref:uncharacterized protein n=1 Tax=Aspergillus foveolatus TaxID=210207 RepID=UPI003CCD8E2A